MSLKIDEKALKNVDKAVKITTKEFTKALGDILIEKEVIPYKSGALQDSQTIKGINQYAVRLTYNMPYASRVYYHPEFNFNQKHNKYAQGEWVEAVLGNLDTTRLFGRMLKLNLGNLDKHYAEKAAREAAIREREEKIAAEMKERQRYNEMAENAKYDKIVKVELPDDIPGGWGYMDRDDQAMWLRKNGYSDVADALYGKADVDDYYDDNDVDYGNDYEW